MTRRYATALPVLTGLLALLCARRAFADAAACPSMAIDADAAFSTRWPGLIGRIREAFDGRDDIDRCAGVTLTMRGVTITVAAVLPDGRSAVRSVSRREDVVPTLEALLLLPQPTPPVGPGAEGETEAVEPSGSGPPPASAAPTPSRTSPPATLVVAPGPHLTVRDRDASRSSAESSPSSLRIELSVITGARMGDGQVSVGLGAFSLLDVSGWLVGFEGRADRYKTRTPGSPATSALELAALGGRRFRFRTIALDLVAGPALIPLGTTTFTAPTKSGNQITDSTSSTAPRVLLSARVNFGALTVLRTFVGVDGELGPSRLGDGVGVPDLPRLPVWTLGLALGGTVGTL